jgi:His/Glu/Gln/Arg/opine family amino acid ABC transporter permease subunit
MIDSADPRSTNTARTLIPTNTPVLPPPLLKVGPIAWVRNNLFSSWVDTLITIFCAILIVGVISAFITWAVGQANWFVVSFNWRLLILGRYPQEAEWRVSLLAVITAFAIGMALAVWARVSRLAVLLVALIVAVLWVCPPLIYATTTLSPSYMAAGSTELKFAASAITPDAQVGFIAKAGETITIKIADQYAANDGVLSSLYGFSDKAASLVANAASSRLATQQQLDTLNDQLASDLLTAGQRTRLTAQVNKLVVPAPITEMFEVNKSDVQVQLLRGSTLEPLASGVLSVGSAAISLTLPDDGWYILEKSLTDTKSKGATLLEITGIVPIIERNFTRSGDVDEGGNVSVAERIVQYIRVTDNYLTEEKRPAPNGKNVPMAILIDNAYRGNHTVTDFLRLFVAPFFDILKLPALAFAIAGALGYVFARSIDVFIPPIAGVHRASARATTWVLVSLPILMFILVYGVGNLLPLTDTRRWGGLLLTIMLTVVGTIASFPLGILLALGRRSKLPVIRIACTIYIEFVRGVPLITVLFMAQLLLPLVNPSLAELPNAFRAMIAITLFNAAYLAENVRGGLQAIPPGQEEAAKALGLSNYATIVNIMLPQALRAVLPALVGMVISLFKDTSLVAIVGLLDLTGMAQNIVTQTEFIGLRRETLLVITILYFGFSYAIALVARRIEESGAGVVRMRKI